MDRIREVPEIGNMDLRNKIVNNLDLVDEETVKFLSSIPKGSKIIEIEGGMGEISEHLSELGNSVRLIGDQRHFFVYREQVFPRSKVIPMNLNPDAIKAGNKVYYDYAIVHTGQYIPIAMSIANFVYNVVTKEIITGIPIEPKKENNAEKPVDSAKKPVIIPKDEDVKSTTKKIAASNDTILIEQIAESDTDSNSIPTDNESGSNLE